MSGTRSGVTTLVKWYAGSPGNIQTYVLRVYRSGFCLSPLKTQVGFDVVGGLRVRINNDGAARVRLGNKAGGVGCDIGVVDGYADCDQVEGQSRPLRWSSLSPWARMAPRCIPSSWRATAWETAGMSEHEGIVNHKGNLFL